MEQHFGIPSKEQIDFEVEELERKLTPESRKQVRKYIDNCNDETDAVLLLRPFERYLGMPISNSFFLHELVEVEEFRKKGFEFVEVDRPDYEFRKKRAKQYDDDREPHLAATLVHCRYLWLKALQRGLKFSLAACILLDPLSPQKDKEALFAKYPIFNEVEKEKDEAFNFFVELIKDEPNIFDPYVNPISFGSSRMVDAVFKRK